MTDVVRPSRDAVIHDPQVARATRLAGAREDYIADSGTALLRDEAGDFNTNDSLGSKASNEFALVSSSGSSFDVVIDGGEAVVGGALLARDTQTTVTLASSTNNQSVYVGWGRDTNDTLVIWIWIK